MTLHGKKSIFIKASNIVLSDKNNYRGQRKPAVMVYRPSCKKCQRFFAALFSPLPSPLGIHPQVGEMKSMLVDRLGNPRSICD